ncbi:MAG: exodeoxyribonuclease VII large subunit [Thermoflexales bacterium]|nr:exodeoxyribonuclease VII large subunit [Thermoflexales bacterium]MDW8291734.1 exodeoxyribonuclease VII large subunit [Anaerolineae bacterium]
MLFDWMPKPPWSVSALTEYVKALLEGDPELHDLRVQGEIAQISRPTSGHLYFTLKDEHAQLRCVMWRNWALRLDFTPKVGDAVIVRGNLGVYERDGQYQLYANAMVLQGAGALQGALEAVKRRLAAEGLFDPARKRPLPAFPRVLGIVTSPTGAALQDVLNVLRRRYPLVTVVLAPTLVQGDEAPVRIVRALARLNELHGELRPDVILVARGGGSAEDLSAFNDERVVRAVAQSSIPIISGVGHEIDVTLTDFAADQRAPTPSAAAEVLTPDLAELRQQIDDLAERLQNAAGRQFRSARQRWAQLARALQLLQPGARLAAQRARLEQLRLQLERAKQHRLERARLALRALTQQLHALSPQAVLARGYAIVRRADDGRVVRAVHEVQPDVLLQITLHEGEIVARVVAERL